MNIYMSAMREISELMKVLGDDTRLRLIGLLKGGPQCVCHLEAALGLPQPTVSRHLGVLRNGGVVEGERRGSWIYYRLRQQETPERQQILWAVLSGMTTEENVLDAAQKNVRCEEEQECC